MSRPITARQLRRLEATIDVKLREYQRMRLLLCNVDQEVFKAGIQLFQSEAGLALWLCAPALALGGKTPLRVMRTAKGRKTVASILGAISQGGYL